MQADVNNQGALLESQAVILENHGALLEAQAVLLDASDERSNIALDMLIAQLSSESKSKQNETRI